MEELSAFSKTIFERTYSFYPGETWEECARRVARTVANDHKQEEDFFRVISTRCFIPGGRYLYTSGRKKFYCSNCFGLLVEDSRESWAQLLHDVTMCLSTGGGLGVNYSLCRPSGAEIQALGGTASGPVSLMQMVNEVARHVMAGGKRRSALLGSLNWNHPDIHTFIKIKDWDEDTRLMKAKKFEYPAPLDNTNISVNIGSDYLAKIDKGDPIVTNLHLDICERMMRTGEPGFLNMSRRLQDDPDAITTNACVPHNALFLTYDRGYERLENLKAGSLVWSGSRWTKLIKIWSTGIKEVFKYTLSNGLVLECTDDHLVIEKGKRNKADQAKTMTPCLGDGSGNGRTHPYATLAGLVQGDGTTTQGSSSCNFCVLNIGAKDQEILDYVTTTGVLRNTAKHEHKTLTANLTVSPEELHIQRKGILDRTIDSFWMQATPETQRLFLRGLFSANGNVLEKNGPRVALKTSNRTLAGQVQLMLYRLGMSSYITTNKAKKIRWHNGEFVSRESYDVNCGGFHAIKFMKDISFIHSYKIAASKPWTEPRYTRVNYPKVKSKEQIGFLPVFDFTVEDAQHTAGVNGIVISNCGETTLHRNDNCNIGSIVLPKITDLNHLEEVVRIAIQFMINGSVKGIYPTEDISKVVKRNRRVGLGIMGLHEFMLLHNHKYEWFDVLEDYIKTWAETATDEAERYAHSIGEKTPIATRAIAPNGTISIIAGTTSGIEPIFCKAYKRRFIDNGVNKFQYVIDPTTKKLLDLGIPDKHLEDAHMLAHDLDRRLYVQAKIQEYTDQAISNTINLPAFGTIGNNNVEEFSQTILKYLPSLKGLTTYPDGSRSGQPLTRVEVHEAAHQEGVTYEEDGDACNTGVCGL